MRCMAGKIIEIKLDNLSSVVREVEKFDSFQGADFDDLRRMSENKNKESTTLRDDFILLNTKYKYLDICRDYDKREQLEDLVYLCLNPEFTKDISNTRSTMTEILKVNLPINITGSKPDAENALREALFRIYKINRDWYVETTEKISSKYNLPPSSLALADDDISSLGDFLEDISAIGIIDNLIFFNDPCSVYGDIEFDERKGGYIRLVSKKDEESFIYGKFYINSTKEDIKAVIERDFPKIAEQRKIETGIPYKKRDSYKTDLYSSILAYKLDKEGKTLTQIALTIDKERGRDNTEGISENAVIKLISRLQENIDRFNRQEN